MSENPFERPTESLHPGPKSVHAAGPVSDTPGRLSRIGPYAILKVLGEGGMGTVYLAEQTAPIHRKVALKIIKLGMDTRSVIARFEAEREALALMNHPNVAKVFDAGTTEQGRPYFVMEYVEGVPITQYCDSRRLSVAQRLQLFTQVCRAIQHAHQKGIIHRDIKPSNILVAPETLADPPARAEARNPGAEYVKVIDFGIAKATQQKLTEQTFATEQGILVGTPAYMSPEQTDPRSTDIDTRTDVYSLGVLLYELLVGSLPFDSENLRRAALTEIVRIVREVDPPKPSSRIGAVLKRTPVTPAAPLVGDPSQRPEVLTPDAMKEFDTATIASFRATDSRSLHRQVRGELDWIVMKCLEKDPARRYQSATELIDEIHRHLSQQPVLAGPPSAAYRLRKFVRRNKLPVSAAAGVLVALTAGLIGTSLMYLRANQERARSEIAAGFLSDILKGAAPAVARGRDAAMLKEMVDAAAVRIRKGELKDNADADLMLRMTLGQTYLDLGVLSEAKSLGESAATMVCGPRGVEQDDCADARLLLANAHSQSGDYATAMPMFDELIAGRRRINPEGDLRLAQAAFSLGSIFNLQGKFSEARQCSEVALTIQQTFAGADSVQASQTRQSLGMTLMNLTEYEAAISMMQPSLRALENSLGPDHPYTIGAMGNLGRVYAQAGKLDDALAILEECVQRSRRTFTADHPSLARMLQFHASAHSQMQNPKDAIPLFREALEITQKSVGPDSPQAGTLQSELGLALLGMGHFDEAEEHLRAAVNILAAEFGESHPDVVLARQGLARALYRNGRDIEADRVLEQSIQQVRARIGERHFNVLTMRINLGAFQLSVDEYAKAENTLSAACADMTEFFGENHPGVGACKNALALAHACQGDWARAETEMLAALAIWTRANGENHPVTHDMRANLALILSAQQKYDEAEKLAQSTISAFDALGEKDRPSRHDAEVTIGSVLATRGQFAEAERLLLKAYEATSGRTDAGQCSNREIVRRIVGLYEAWIRANPEQKLSDDASNWRKRLDELNGEIELRQGQIRGAVGSDSPDAEQDLD